MKQLRICRKISCKIRSECRESKPHEYQADVCNYSTMACPKCVPYVVKKKKKNVWKYEERGVDPVLRYWILKNGHYVGKMKTRSEAREICKAMNGASK